MFNEFKKFILRGNVIDLAVGVVIGSAFNGVVQALVKDIITPILPVNGADGFASATFAIGKNHVFHYGDFINVLVSFLVIAFVVFFFVVQPINKLSELAMRTKETPEPTTRKCPYCFGVIPRKASRCQFCTSKVEPKTS
ncbi:MAG TPA: large conductance mechanosensitive channel protein MscL [Candidatus Saccharimonadales bacterium]|nr:large conductance mechanosensitive channel protein MscL [Candidatus Saccharimonadales bacterium]